MVGTSLADWLALAGILLSLASLAWSARRYVSLKEREDEHLRYRRFFEIMEMIGSSGSIAAKVAAVYQLRKYPEYGDLLERFCRDVQTNVTGDGAQLLIDKLRRTTNFFEEQRGKPK